MQKFVISSDCVQYMYYSADDNSKEDRCILNCSIRQFSLEAVHHRDLTAEPHFGGLGFADLIGRFFAPRHKWRNRKWHPFETAKGS